MPLVPVLAQTVAVGPFNPFIITPAWLLRYEVCLEDEAAEFCPGALTNGSGFMLGAMEWEVDYRRLMVSSPSIRIKARETCGDKTAKVMKLLSHTPVEAVGHNFHFSCGLEDWSEKPSPQLGGRKIRDFSDAQQFRWVGVFRRDDVQIEVRLAVAPAEGVAVRFTHERRTDPTDAGSAVAAAEQFMNDYRHSQRMLTELFDVEVTDE